MGYKVTYLLSAEKSLDDLLKALQTHAPGTLKATYSELDSITNQLETFPYAYQETANPAVRRAFLNAARHTLYFRIEARNVTVLAVLPQRLGSKTLRKRGLVN